MAEQLQAREMRGRSDDARARDSATREMSEERPVSLIEVRPVPARAESRAIELWGREVGPLAVAATAGAAAGIVTVAVARAARTPRRPPRRGFLRRREKVVASRSFLVDVHILGR